MSEQPESKTETEEKKDKGAKPLSEDEARDITGGRFFGRPGGFNSPLPGQNRGPAGSPRRPPGR